MRQQDAASGSATSARVALGAASSSRPWRNQACGVRKLRRLRTSGACERSKNDPPRMPRVTATIAFQPPACSSVRASVTTSAVIPIAARTAADDEGGHAERVAPVGAEQQRRGDARSRPSPRRPGRSVPSALPATIAHGRDRRGHEPRAACPAGARPRSERMPNCAVKNRKKIAMLAGKKVAGVMRRSSASASTS